MKKILVLFSLFLIGCSTEVITESQPNDRYLEEVVNIEETISEDEFVDFDSYSYIPNDAKESNFFSLDLDSDGVSEHVVYYTLEDVPVRVNDLREISYLKVYQWLNGSWEVIKEDQVTIEGGVINSSFNRIEKVEFESQDYILVVKKQYRGPLLYYVYGYDGVDFDDLSIPKGYLNRNDYLNEDDTLMYLYDIKVEDNTLVEYYFVECEKYSQLAMADNKSCYRFELVQSFDNGFDSEPTIRNYIEREE